MTVTVYGRQQCYACRATERQLEKQGTTYVKHDVDVNHDARQTVEESGKLTLPFVVVLDDEHNITDSWHGLRPERIRKLVNR